MSVWDLIENGSYEEACDAADREYAVGRKLSTLRNKVLALLCLGQPELVIDLTAFIIKEDKYSVSSDLIFLGVAHWSLGQNSEAVAAWSGATRCMYTDAAGGVDARILLHYAGIRLCDRALVKEALKLLKSRCRELVRSWPAPLAGYHLGLLSQDDVLAAVSTNETLRARQECQAFFCFGVLSLAAEDEGEALSHFRNATSKGTGSMLEHEYYLARHEQLVLESGSLAQESLELKEVDQQHGGTV